MSMVAKIATQGGIGIAGSTIVLQDLLGLQERGVRVDLASVGKKLDQTALSDHMVPKMCGIVCSGLRNVQKDIGVNSVGRSQFLVRVATFSIVRRSTVTSRDASGIVCSTNRGLTV
ncbi:unnamed protein product [Prorocentrum cordatum]|uniref:Malate dehydrogenase n=1 Tax=Prorocentrum cordatum TaxID=2364126 RepID=A0ABN9TW91_9DINO|nr:unnamed protein product [Polarella glacialis]